MVFDRTDQEFHLTKKGWVTGTYKYFGNIQGENIKTPNETVETWVRHMKQDSGHSPEVISWTLISYDPSIPEAERKRLRKSFPKPAEDFPEDVHMEDRKEKVIRELKNFVEAKSKLEQNILTLVKEFEKETGRPVTDIKFSRKSFFDDFGNEKSELKVSIST